ncbi:hypothetical protein EC912_1045 [Luteibacter rhizovicinus]|uniref:DUF2946 family protein n=1 Tax=Luteibacter rhizovicinus TaxID=242606 RepID=A0A4R3YNI6_9GAMM|nr:hypothetical protein [Luteibacter rhizovicinus]TCV93812.1 hypothetical protein EC912_1045 [Luteibacter rhizovicinus]
MTRMHRPSSSLLQYLRRHRGFMVLALMVFFVRLAAATVCIEDGPGVRTGFDGGVTVSAPSDLPDGDCLLGEQGGCHCACAHASPMPATAIARLTPIDTSFVETVSHPDTRQRATGSLFRPPIA